MELVQGTLGRRRLVARRNAVAELRDVGERLEYVLGRYGRLVREVSDGTVPVPDLTGRVALLNSHLVFVAETLQEVLVLEHENARSVSLGVTPARAEDVPRFAGDVVSASA